METIVYQIEFNDGRVFRIFCANLSQKKKVIESYERIKGKLKEVRVITTGIHTVAQYEKILSTL